MEKKEVFLEFYETLNRNSKSSYLTKLSSLIINFQNLPHKEKEI